MQNQQVSTAWLVRLLGDWTHSDGPLHRQLSDALRELVELGELPQGTKLPSERALSAALAVSRTTVLSAFDTLRKDRQIESQQGSGTRVRRHGANADDHDADGLIDGGRLRGFYAPVPTMIDLSTAAMSGLPLSAEISTNLDLNEVLELTAGHGYTPKGLPKLREALADDYSANGLPTTPEQVLITSGAQQALEVVTAAMLAPGDEVIVEDPTYRGAIQSFQAAGTRMLTVPSGLHGADVSGLETRLAASRARLVYLLPTVQNPTGTVMPEKSRRAIAALATRYGITIVDDASPADLTFTDTDPPPLAAYDPDAPILTIGSCSKLFWGGLRVGWIRAPATVIARLSRVKRGVSELGTSLLSQLVATRLLPHSADAKAQRREQLLQGHHRLTSLLHELFPTWQWHDPDGGAALWVKLPQASSSALAQKALQHGVSIVPGPVFSAEGNFEDYIRLPYGGGNRALHTGIHRLSRAWEEHVSNGTDQAIGSQALP